MRLSVKGRGGKGKAKDEMGEAYAKADQEKRESLVGGDYDRKAFRAWLMQPDAWNGSKGIEEEEKRRKEDDFDVRLPWN